MDMIGSYRKQSVKKGKNSMHRTKLFFLLLSLLLGIFPVKSAELVHNGIPVAEIITGKDPGASAQLAALELQYHIALMTGAKLPILEKVSGKKTVEIHIGPQAPAVAKEFPAGAFRSEEYLVRVSGNQILLTGADKRNQIKVDYSKSATFPSLWEAHGSLYAVYEFLERLGFRWYLPTELGIVYPEKRTLTVSDYILRRSPDCDFRYMDFRRFPADLVGDTLPGRTKKKLSQRESLLWAHRIRLGGEWRLINHSLYRYWTRFPEKKAWAGIHSTGNKGQLCYSDDELVKQVVQDARDFFDGKFKGKVTRYLSNLPNNYVSDCFPLVPMDGGAWCECAKCQKQYLTAPTRGIGQFSNNKVSDYVFLFVNKVAKELKKSHPGKTVGALSYSSYAYPPEGFKLEDNVEIAFCMHTRSYFNGELTENQEAVMAAWHKEYPKMRKNVWMYYCYPTLNGRSQKFRVFPGFFAHHVPEFFKRYTSLGVTGVFFEGSYVANGQLSPIMDQLEGYVTWQLAWNGKRNAEKIINEFFTGYYGPAAAPMKRFYEIVEKAYGTSANWPKGARHMTEAVAWDSLGTDDRMAQLEKEMQEARKVAVREPYKARIALFDEAVWQPMLKGKEVGRVSSQKRRAVMCKIKVPRIRNAQGDPEKINWEKAEKLKLYGGLRAEKPVRDLDVRVVHDGTWIYVSAEEKVDTGTLLTQDQVFLNDDWEFFFAAQRSEPYIHFAVDADKGLTGRHYAGMYREPWKFPGKILKQKKTGSWRILFALKISDAAGTPKVVPGESLYFNVIRATRLKPQGCWIPTFGRFHEPGSFGELYLSE